MAKAKNKHPGRKIIWRIVLFSVLTVSSSASFVVGLVQNGNESVRLYNALIAVDKSNGDVQTALNDLRGFIYSHMNTEIGGPNGIYPPIQLKSTYERLVSAEQARVDKINSSLYSKAQKYCEKNGSQGFSGRNRLDCIKSYVDTHGTSVRAIDDSLYKYDFVAPRWSPDMAGYSLVLMIIFGMLFILELVLYFRVRYLIR